VLTMREEHVIKIKRVYELATRDDGECYLIEGLWPRGIKRESLKLKAWLKDIAASTELRQRFAHDPAKWTEFQRRYSAELTSDAAALQSLIDATRRGTVTLLYSAYDTEYNSAIVLKTFLEQKLKTKT
jgi:uncharacterized protein YeaO (DUF488 family)